MYMLKKEKKWNLKLSPEEWAGFRKGRKAV